MKEFTDQEIEKTRQYFLSQNYPTVEQDIGGRHISYFLLPQSLNPDLPNFVLRLTGKSANYVLGVSDKLDERLRPYAALEEYIEFVEKGIDAPNRVVEAECEVLGIVPEEIRPEYAKMRRDFFEKLMECARQKPDMYIFSSSDIEEFEKNLAMLEGLVAKISAETKNK